MVKKLIVYVISVFLTSLTSFITQYIQDIKNNKTAADIFAILTAAILIFVSGFRWYVGTDYANYANAYVRFKEQVWGAIITYNEPGIRVLSLISQYIYDDYASMFFISSIITVGLFVYTMYKYSDSFFISISLYVFGHGWTEAFNGIRQMLASAILFAGHRFILEREFKKYLIIVLLAASFHISALVMIFLYFIPRTKMSLKKVLIILVIVVISISTYEILFDVIDTIMSLFGDSLVMTDYITREINFLRILVMMAPPILYLLIAPRNKFNEKDNFYMNMLFINAAIYMASINSAYLARFALYTIPYVTMGLPIILKYSKKSLGVMAIYIALILYFSFWMFDVSNTESLYNFQWIFGR